MKEELVCKPLGITLRFNYVVAVVVVTIVVVFYVVVVVVADVVVVVVVVFVVVVAVVIVFVATVVKCSGQLTRSTSKVLKKSEKYRRKDLA